MVLGVHTAWGRTLKDVFQRYKAMRGFHQRYQNGFDCQGLWIEVGVERELGLNSKREIEEYGLAEFARRCRDVVVRSSQALTDGSIRLGQWMDWGNDYFTFSDTNIEYIWRFLKIVHERGWLYLGHRSTEWCPRCGTSISQHELTQSGVYQDRTDPSLFVRFPLLDHAGRVARRSGRRRPGRCRRTSPLRSSPTPSTGVRENGEWVAVARYPDEAFAQRRPGRGARRTRATAGPFDDLGPGGEVEHRVIPWDEVVARGGHGHRPHRPGRRAGGLRARSASTSSPCSLRSTRRAASTTRTAGCTGSRRRRPPTRSSGGSPRRASSSRRGRYEHRYPHCWRCDTPLIWRVTDDWLIARRRAPAAAARRERDGRVDARVHGQAHGRLAPQHGRLEHLAPPLLRAPAAVLPVLVRAPERHRLARPSSSSARPRPVEQLEELRRPWIDEVRIRCEACGDEVERIPEVGDVWLDAGIVPFSTLGWESPEYVPQGYATGAAKGLTTADLPDHAYWEQWFPADWVSEMREQIRLWFYSQLFMSVALTGRAPFRRVLGYEKMLDEKGREMHSSWGNTIDAPDAFARMGADVMRWQYCSQPPNQNLLFGFGPAHEIQRKLLTLWNSCKFLVDYANIDGWEPTWADLAGGPSGELEPLDRWLVAADARARRGGDRRATRAGSRSTSSVRTRRSSTTSRTGTSGARAAGSGTATRSRCGRSGTRSSRGSASSRRSCRSSPTTSGAC